MDNLTLLMIIVLVVLGYLIHSKQNEYLDASNNSNTNEVQEYQTNEVNYGGADVESRYFNQLQRNNNHNERKYWLENQLLEQEFQQTHQCNL
jgi:hypothetical protein